MRFRFGFVNRAVVVLLAVAWASVASAGEEKHVRGVVARILENVRKVRAADPEAVPMAFWDFDGTLIRGDSSIGTAVDKAVRYRGLLRAAIEEGFLPMYRGADGYRKWWGDYTRMMEIGPWLAQGYDAQMFTGVSAAELDAFCRKTIREERMDRWYFASSMAIWKALDEAGVENYVVSANIDALVRNMASTLGVSADRIRGTRTELDGGRWTTRLLQPIPYGEGKADLVRNLVRACPHGVAIAAFGNSYETDGAFLRHVATQPSLPGGAVGTAMMINGKNPVPGFREHFICVEQSAVVGDGTGILLLTFDDPCWDGWVKAMPLFEKYGAHATFFPCGRLDATNAIPSLQRLVAAGHTVGSHSVSHRDVPKVFYGEEGPEMYGRTELKVHARKFAEAGLPLEYFAYPNNRRTDETDALLSLMGGFRRFRAGAKTFRYNTNGASIVTLDQAFFPVEDLPKRRVMRGTGVGSYYNTDIEDICRGIRRAGERNEVFVLFSHDIAEKPGAVGMRLDWLERILATAAACGVAVKGFSELGPVDPQEPSEPMRVTLTFDDNVRDHLLIAAPELEKRGWKGLFSIVTDWVGKTNKLSWAEVRELRRRGHEIAVHTKSHPNCGLGAMADRGELDAVRREIAEARDILTHELGEKPRYLCLPGSDYTPAVGRIAREEGLEPMLVKRACCGRGIPDTAGMIKRLRAHGVPRYDFLVHGVCKAGGGWEPYPTKEDFIRHLDALQAAEKAGEIRIVTYDEIKENPKWH